MTAWVSVSLRAVQGQLGHLVFQSIGSHLQVVELGVYFAHDKALLFWLVARQHQWEWKHMHTLFPMLRVLQGPAKSHLPADLYVKPEDKKTLALSSENVSQLEYRVIHHNSEKIIGKHD